MGSISIICEAARLAQSMLQFAVAFKFPENAMQLPRIPCDFLIFKDDYFYRRMP
jgi:hypothetical protein